MRLMSTKTVVEYIDVIDREPYTEADAPEPGMVGQPNPDGAPVEGATIWKFRGLTSAEEGALMDGMFDLGKTSVNAADEDNAKVDMAMSIKPSVNRRARVMMALVGWDNLYVMDEEGETVNVPYIPEEVSVGGQKFKGAPNAVMDMMDGSLIGRMERFVKSLSGMEPGMGKP